MACLVTAISVFSLVRADADPDPYWPLAKGTYWIYEGDVSWSQKNPATGQNEICEKRVRWRSEVVNAVEDRDDPGIASFHSVALLRGFPTDLTWSSPDAKPADRLLFHVGTDYYETTNKAAEIFQRIKGPGYLATTGPKGDTNKANLLFSTPLALGKRIDGGDVIAAFFTDRYCSVVESVAPFDLRTVKHAPELSHPLAYSVTWQSNPDNEQMDFVPGLGITFYSYHHHGTVMDVALHLVEFGQAQAEKAATHASAPGPD